MFIYSEKAKKFENETSNRIGRIFFHTIASFSDCMNFKESINFMLIFKRETLKV